MATDRTLEGQPLLGNENVNYCQYNEGRPTAPPYIESSVATVVELPPPYSPSVHETRPVVSCRICGLNIDISDKANHHVVECNFCHEATPIKSAPLGKRYVRCPCNCLLICKASSKRISCPRQNCKRIICLSPSSIAIVPPNSPGVCQVICPYCRNGFFVNLIQSNWVRCGHCRKKCSLIPEYARKRTLITFLLALGFLIFFMIITATTHQLLSSNPGLYGLYIFLAVCIAVCSVRSFLYFTLKSVIIETPA